MHRKTFLDDRINFQLFDDLLLQRMEPDYPHLETILTKDDFDLVQRLYAEAALLRFGSVPLDQSNVNYMRLLGILFPRLNFDMRKHARKEGLLAFYIAQDSGFHPAAQFEVFGYVFHNPRL